MEIFRGTILTYIGQELEPGLYKVRVYPYSWSSAEVGFKRRTVSKAPVAPSEVEREGGEAERKHKENKVEQEKRTRRRKRRRRKKQLKV